MNYFKILLFLEKGNRDLFTYPKEEQIAYMNSLGEPGDDIDRGYKQYLCQNQLVLPKWKRAFFNTAGVVALPFMILYFMAKRLFVRRAEHINCLIEKKGMPEVIPNEVIEEYRPSEEYQVGSSLGFCDLAFVLKLLSRAPFSPYFVFKAMMNVTRYSHLIYRYSPKTMIQFGEFSFSSSILTEYCHRYGIKHVDIMHGEKLFYIRDAFFHYDESYVWSNHYKDLLISLKAEPAQFRIAVPPSLKIDNVKYRNNKVYADYKYYLAPFTEDKIKRITESMEFAKKEGKTVKYRPHPRYSDIGLLKKYVSDDDIEMPNLVSIQESVANMSCAVGSYSTVLVQAYFSGKNVLMDDVAEKQQYLQLRELNYILSDDSFDRLSNYQK